MATSEQRQVPHTAPIAKDYGGFWLWISFAAFLGCYLVLSVQTAAQKPFWMDEVLAVWLSRLPSPSAINQALMRGAQSAPPAYSVLLHYIPTLFNNQKLTLRLLSLAGAIVAAWCVFLLMRRYLSVAAALFAACLMLESWSPYAVQVRPYTLVTACFAAALLLWDDLNARASNWRVLFIGLLLAFAVALHFYAVFFVPCLGLLELLRALHTRRLRYFLWAALVLAGASIFLWFPLMRATSRYVASDVAESRAPGAAPSLNYIISTYTYFFQGLADTRVFGRLGLNGLIVLSALALILLGRLYQNFRGNLPEPVEKIAGRRDDFWRIAIVTTLFPLIVFVFTLFVTRYFNLRYVLVGAIGTSAILAEILSAFPPFRRVAPAILLAASLLTIQLGIPASEWFDHAAVYNAMPGPYPIVAADGSQFFQLEESAPAEFRARIVYLMLPSNIPVADVMNQHVISRWTSVNPNLPVEEMSAFLNTHRRFYVLDEQTADDTPALYLLLTHRIERWKEIGGAVIYRSHTDW